MGIYRLLLAIAVLLSHLGVQVFGLEIGVFAVVSFYLLSGFVMTAVIERHYAETTRIGAFYVDRAMRLFPQYLLYIALTLCLVVISHPVSPYLAGLSSGKIALNALMLPMNFYAHFGNTMIIPQAWSLGLESQFYAIIPLVILFRVRAAVLIASFVFFALPYFGYLDTDTWGYRMLPGTLFMFMIGSFLYRSRSPRAIAVCYAVVVAAFALVLFDARLRMPYNLEVTAGLVFGIPAVLALSRLSFGRFEAFAGNLSYGVFLNHFFVIWLFQVAGIETSHDWYPWAVTALSIALAWVSYASVERPVIALRHAIRARRLIMNSAQPRAMPEA